MQTGGKEKLKLPNHIQFDTVSPATKLLEKRRKMYEVHEAFEAQKEEFKKQETIFKSQEDAIRERDLAIQEDLIRFCKFLQDNEAKKNRADKRAQDEEKAGLAKQKEIDELKLMCTEHQKTHAKLERKVAALKKYEDYLESVIRSNQDQYQNISDLISRYKNLNRANENLVRDQKNMEEELERLKIECANFEKDKNHEILQLNNEIKELQKNLEEKQKERNELQANVEISTKKTSSKNLNLGRVIMAIDNLYSRCQQIDILKIRAEIDPGKNEKENKKKDKKDKKNEKNKQENAEEDPNEDYTKRSQDAIAKMRAIGQYMADFKTIIKRCQTEIPGKKITIQ